MNNLGRMSTFGLCVLAMFLLAACAETAQVSYLQDLQRDVPMQVQEPQQLTLKPGDRLQINVFSRDRELAELFNLTTVNNNYGAGNDRGYRYYTVDPKGDIEMPTLGPVHVAGLNRLEVADLVKYKLLESKMLLDPTVIVEYAGLSFSVLGETGRRGRIEIPTDQITILEALSLAGDLTIDGKRENVLVLRTENGTQRAYSIDLTKTESVYNSPVYYIQQNDLIYVEPNKKRQYQSDVNATYFHSFGFWVSIPSLLVSLVTLVAHFWPAPAK